MKIFFDTEFIENGETIELLSIGMVREDGETYYAELAETDRSRASEWVQENVIPHLTGPVKPRWQIANNIINFAGHNPEFWAYYADYDWVALCQLYGTMMDLPDGWPMFCMDLKQLAVQHGNPDLHKLAKVDGPEHNALADARWVADAWHALQSRGGNGAALIAAERLRQVESEGYTSEHDARHGSQLLILAAIAYAHDHVGWWPWGRESFKVTSDRVRNLTKAGALIAAAIDVDLSDRRSFGSES